MFAAAAAAIKRHLVHFSRPSGQVYIAEMQEDGTPFHKMDHLVCFAGGMFMLAAQEWPESRPKWEVLAKGLGVCSLPHDTSHFCAYAPSVPRVLDTIHCARSDSLFDGPP